MQKLDSPEQIKKIQIESQLHFPNHILSFDLNKYFIINKMEQYKEIQSVPENAAGSLLQNILRQEESQKEQNTSKQVLFREHSIDNLIQDNEKNQNSASYAPALHFIHENQFKLCSNFQNKFFKDKNISLDNLQHQNSLYHRQDNSEENIVKTNLQSSILSLKRQKKTRQARVPKNKIFKEKNLKQITSKVPLAKYLVRLFIKYHKSFPVKGLVSNFNDQMAPFLKNEKKNHISMNDVVSIFGGENDTHQEINYENRRLVWKIIRQHMKDQLIFNQSLGKNKRSYFLAVKVFQHRCRSEVLAKRSNFR